MTDREALYRAILANPDDDTLRLIYADALEEDGDGERAAFIRNHVRLAGLPEYDPAWVRARYRDHIDRFADEWKEELPRLPDGLSWADQPFRRGLPAAVTAPDPAAFVGHADELFAHFPIESLELEVAQVSGAERFAECPWV